MGQPETFTIREAFWSQDADLLRSVRHAVFVVEQNVPPELEWEGEEDQFRHVVAMDVAGTPIGTGRVSRHGKIGRMAVLASWRGKGVGGAILNQLMQIADSMSCRQLELSAQLHALPFYRKFGFTEQGDVFIEAGIKHMKMSYTVPS